MSDTDLQQAVEGFRRAEAALAAITDDANVIASASTELGDARQALASAGQDLKVVAGALVGLASAHQELVAQLGTAATALAKVEPRALEAAPAERSGEVAQVLAAVERLGTQLDAVKKAAEAAPKQKGGRAVAATRPAEERAADPAVVVERIDDAVGQRLDEVERRLAASQRRIYELVLVEGLAFLVLAAMIAVLATR